MTQLVGIVNVTPDSFSDGGQHESCEAALKHTRQLINDGASIVDIGAESTRPSAKPLPPEDEWQRLKMLCKELQKHAIPFSIDTRHVETAKRALDHGATWLNDVSGAADDAMIQLAIEHNVSLVAMHNLGIPARKDITIPEGDDVIHVIQDWANTLVQRCTALGLAEDKLILDPGIGFGKTAEQSLLIITHASALTTHGSWLFGHSRKSFYSLLSDLPAGERDELTAITSAQLATQGVDYLRVHNVAINKHALNTA